MSVETEIAALRAELESMRGVVGADFFAVQKQAASTAIRRVRLLAARALATHSHDQWTCLVAEFGGRCVRCGDGYCPMQKDHIVPLYQGGSDGIDNLQPLCPRCNRSKGPESTNWAVHRRKNGFGGQQ